MTKAVVQAQIKVVGIEQTIRDLNLADKQLVRELRKEIGVAIRPTARKIKKSIPSIPPISGMIHQGRTRWSPVRATVKLNAKTREKRPGVNPLVSIDVTGSPQGLGFDYAELAGASERSPRARSKVMRRTLVDGSQSVEYTKANRSGKSFIENLNYRVQTKGKAGRFAFRIFIGERERLNRETLVILEKYSQKVNRKLRRTN